MIERKTVFVFKCFGCSEVFFPEEDIDGFIRENSAVIAGVARIDYLCNEEFTKSYLNSFDRGIKESERIVVFSCGVGVQVVAKLLENKRVLPGCDTHYLKGFQGITSQDADCEQCGSCYLNMTGGICPLTACAKGLLNGPCGGANEKGKCEVNPEIDCGWILIYNRLKDMKEEKIMAGTDVKIRDYSLITGEKTEKK